MQQQLARSGFGGTGVNFINILLVHFLYKSAFLPKSFCQSQNVTSEKLQEALSYEKRARKMLMKLTPVKPFLHALLVLHFISLTQILDDRNVSEAKNVRIHFLCKKIRKNSISSMSKSKGAFKLKIYEYIFYILLSL